MPVVLTKQEVMEGHGSPEGAVSATAGTLYRNLDGGPGASLWAKTYGPGTTGWVAQNDPKAPIAFPSGVQLPSLAGMISGNQFVVQAEQRLYLVQGSANATAEDQFGQYPTDIALASKKTLIGGLIYSGTAHANSNRLVSGVAFLNLGASVPHEVSYHLDDAGTVGADIVTVYLGSDGTAGSGVGYAVAINRSGAYTIKNGTTTVASGTTGQAMIGAAVEVAVLLDGTGKVFILRNGQIVASFTPSGANPTFGNYVGISPSLVYSAGVISWVAAALGTLNWMRLEAVPTGGTTSQALRKVSGTDFDYAWEDDPPPTIPGINTVRSGAGAPDNAVGQNGDWYLQTGATPTIYGPKTGGVWPAGVALVGPQGIQGIQGIQGNPGTSLRYGAGAPDNAVGFAGEYYIDQTNARLYGPKGSSTWPGGYISLVGPQGPQGIQGVQGATGATGAAGATGPQGATAMQHVQEFLATGAFTFTVPTGVNAVDLFLVAGGGGFNVAAGLGGAAGGQVIKKRVAVTPGATISGTIGAGGANNGGKGGDSTFGAITAKGGNGNNTTNGYGGPGGGPSNALTNGGGGGAGADGPGGNGASYEGSSASAPAGLVIPVSTGGGPAGGVGVTGFSGWVGVGGEGGRGVDGYAWGGRGSSGGREAANAGPANTGAGADAGGTGTTAATGGSGYCLVSWEA